MSIVLAPRRERSGSAARDRALPLLGLLALSGCAAPPVPDIQETSRRTARLETPATVKAGPYRMDFVAEGSEARYMEWEVGADHATVTVEARFTLARPKGAPARVRMVVTPAAIKSGLDPAFDPGTSYGDLSGPKPNWVDMVYFTLNVPPGWRGESVVVAGELQEVASEPHTASFRTLRLGPGPEPAAEGWPRPGPSVIVPAPEAVGLAHGVVATMRPQAEATSALPLTIDWDPRRVLPKWPKETATLSILRTNVGKLGAQRGSGEGSFVLELGEDPDAETDPKEVRVDFEFVKPARRYPFLLPIRLVWPKEPAPPRG